MSKTNQKNNSVQISKSSGGVIYQYPKSEEIFIDKSNLQIQLSKFKDKIKKEFSVYDFLALISLWSPILSADFKKLFGLLPESVKFGYIIFAALITFFIIFSKLSIKRDNNTNSDPEIMAQKILEQCQKKK